MSDTQIQKRLKELAEQRAMSGSGLGKSLKKGLSSAANLATKPGVASTALLLTGNPNAALAARSLGYGMEGGYYKPDKDGNLILIKSRKTVPKKHRGKTDFYNDEDLPMGAIVNAPRNLSSYQLYVKTYFKVFYDSVLMDSRFNTLSDQEKRNQAMKELAKMWKKDKAIFEQELGL